MPWCFGTSGSVRARRIPQCDRSAWLDHTFWPLMIQVSPSRTARVASPARSEPAPGSEKQLHPGLPLVRDLGEEPPALVLGSPLEEGLGHVDAQGIVGAGHLVLAERPIDDGGPHRVQAEAAVLDRPVREVPAGLAEPLPPVAGVEPFACDPQRRLVVGVDGRDPFGRQGRSQPVDDLGAQFIVALGNHPFAHVRFPWTRRSKRRRGAYPGERFVRHPTPTVRTVR